MIQAKDIYKSYGSLQVLKGVSIQVQTGEIVSIVGASGAGKSTLLHIIGTLDRPDKGTLSLCNTSLEGLSDKKLSLFRNQNIGFVFQFHHLLPEFSALENICIPAYIGGVSGQVARERALELMSALGISSKENNKPSELSGGEQQRVAVARALINKPSVVLADEPSGNLDSANARELHDLFFQLRKQYNQTFVIVTHNEEFATMADRRLVMKDGIIIE